MLGINAWDVSRRPNDMKYPNTENRLKLIQVKPKRAFTVERSLELLTRESRQYY